LQSFAFTKRSTNGTTARACNRKRRSLKSFQVIFASKRAMKSSFIVLLLFATFSSAQDNNPAASSDHSKQKKGFVTVQGWVSRSSGDYGKRVFATLADNVIITAGSDDQAEVP